MISLLFQDTQMPHSVRIPLSAVVVLLAIDTARAVTLAPTGFVESIAASMLLLVVRG
jgi:hypothetical protein